MRDDELLAAYRVTDYEVHAAIPFALHVDRHSPELDTLLAARAADCAAFITAWNPRSLPRPEVENRAAQNRLEAELQRDGFECVTGFGRDPLDRWPGEPSVLVLGLPRQQAIECGRRYGQNAVLCVERGRPVELVWLGSEPTR
jgi:Protein of unknown function (DUF3293)